MGNKMQGVHAMTSVALQNPALYRGRRHPCSLPPCATVPMAWLFIRAALRQLQTVWPASQRKRCNPQAQRANLPMLCSNASSCHALAPCTPSRGHAPQQQAHPSHNWFLFGLQQKTHPKGLHKTSCTASLINSRVLQELAK